MATVVYNEGMQSWADRSLDPIANTLVVILLKSITTTPGDRTHQFVSEIVADEADCLGYTGGHGGSGRKSLASKSIGKDDVGHRVTLTATDIDMGTLGDGLGGANDNTIVGYAIARPGTTDDTDAVLLAFLDIPDTATNGDPWTVRFTSGEVCEFVMTAT